MKAMILAAGLGTRLLPYTRHTPKPLFTLNNRPVIDLMMENLARAGCSAVMVNTHYHHEQVEQFLSHHNHGMALHTRHEPEILGTGGAIRNVQDFWSDAQALLVINADIVTDIDLLAVCRFHARHGSPVTMVMHDHPAFNTVVVDGADRVIGFRTPEGIPTGMRRLAFTGIHVLDRRVLSFLPPTGPAHIIDAYEKMLQAGDTIQALIVQDHYWQDIGTPPSYQAAVLDRMAPAAFENAFGRPPRGPVQRRILQGDGSERRWYRLFDEQHTLIMVDHGIRTGQEGQQEVDAFVQIGRHLHAVGAAVPRIYLHDTFSGVAFLEDLGDRRLQDEALRQTGPRLDALYRRVIDLWLDMAIAGGRGFDTGWTYQSTHYDRQVILERECRYFVDAFINDYIGDACRYADLAAEFETLVDPLLHFGWTGFMHRDLQSRNIMLQGDRICFIDFQGGRLGPLQYDLASLLIDPYVALPSELQDHLCRYAAQALFERTGADIGAFLQGYAYCALTRNLQMLGAFGNLSRNKGKRYFEAFIPTALQTLRNRLAQRNLRLPKLTAAVVAATQKVSG